MLHEPFPVLSAEAPLASHFTPASPVQAHRGRLHECGERSLAAFTSSAANPSVNRA